MRVLRIALWRGSAPIAVPAMALLGIFAGSRGGSFLDWLWATGQVQQHGVLLVPLTGAIAAWDVSRDRRYGSPLIRATFPRSPLATTLLNCVGALIAGLVGWAAMFAMTTRLVRGGGEPYWSVVLLGPWCVGAAVLVGAAASRFLPKYLAAPVTAAGTWVLLAFGSGSDNSWVVALSVIDARCCSVGTQPVAATIAGQWLWVAGIALVAAAVVAFPVLRQGIALGSTAVAAVVVAIVLMSLNGAVLVEKRTATAEACRSQDDVTVCMWPEHARDADVWLAAAVRYRAAFADLGDQPRLYVESGLRAPSPGAVEIGAVQHNDDATSLAMNLARSLMPSVPECAKTSEYSSGPYPAASADGLLSAWLTLRLQPDISADQLVMETQRDELDRLRRAPVERQLVWYRDLVRAHGDCTTPAPAVP